MSQDALETYRRLIRERVSAERFDPRQSLDEREIRALVDDAIQAPSSFHIQHWRFVAVRRPEDKRRLQQAAFGQRLVADAAITLIVLGDLRGTERLSESMELAVERGALPEGKAAAWVRMAREIYRDERRARDEALRSGSLAAMVLMLSAHARGLACCALSGFDPQRLREAFGIPSRYVPVMLLALGRAEPGAPHTHKPRLPVEEVLRFDDARGFPGG